MDTKEAVQGCSPWKYKKHFGCANNIEDGCYFSKNDVAKNTLQKSCFE